MEPLTDFLFVITNGVVFFLFKIYAIAKEYVAYHDKRSERETLEEWPGLKRADGVDKFE